VLERDSAAVRVRVWMAEVEETDGHPQRAREHLEFAIEAARQQGAPDHFIRELAARLENLETTRP